MNSYWLIPLVSAFLYALGALFLKHATNAGVGPWRGTFFSNLVFALMVIPLYGMGDGAFPWSHWWMPLLCSVAFFLGQLFTCLAIHLGDVSLSTPLMGTKVLFVAVFSCIFLAGGLGWRTWAGAVLTASAVLLMRGRGVSERRRLFPTLVFGLASAAFYALSDVLVQRFGAEIGFFHFISLMFVGVALWSLVLIPFFSSPVRSIQKRTWGWLMLACVVMAVQGGGIIFTIATHGHATEANILYSTRGIWSVVLVFLLGARLRSQEGTLGREVLMRRLGASIIILTAIVLIVK